jgi:hypothetical protein
MKRAAEPAGRVHINPAQSNVGCCANGFSIFGKPPSRDSSGFDPAIIVKEERLKKKTAAKQNEFEKKFQNIKAQLQAVQERCAAND